jgi:hypothetical protein
MIQPVHKKAVLHVKLSSMLVIVVVCDVHFIKISALGLWLGQHGVLDEICSVNVVQKMLSMCPHSVLPVLCGCEELIL